jgi:hypothetical protein
MQPINSYKQLIRFIVIFGMSFLIAASIFAQNKMKQSNDTVEVIEMTSDKMGVDFQLTLIKGPEHNHPTFAIWIEDESGKMLETVFVTGYFAKGIFGYAAGEEGTWKDEPGEAIRPAALPYWSHKRNIISRDSLYVPTPENPVADAISGPTPKGSFTLETKISENNPKSFRVLLEVNQPWDWNSYWTNSKYPDDADYKTSAQPSVVYATEAQLNGVKSQFVLQPVGHGHYSGKDGDLYTDLSTLTTALEIAESISVTIKK